MKKDEIFDAMLDAALEEELLADNDGCAEEHEFSGLHNKKMEKLFKTYSRKQKVKKIAKCGKYAACIMLAVIVVSGISIFSVEAWRVQFMNFVFNSEAPYTIFEFGEEKNFYDDGKISIGYLPLGFELAESDDSRHITTRVFSDKGKYIQITQAETGSKIGIDTEDGIIEKIKIQGYDAVYSSNHNINSVVWSDGYYDFTVLGNIPQEEILKIAESLK